MLLKLEIPAGLYANGTPYQGQGRWNSGNLVRWRSGYMSPVKGWSKFNATQFNGRASDVHQWRDQSDRKVAVGTHTKLYAVVNGGSYQDITPAGYTVGRTDAGNAFGYGLGNYGVGAYGVSMPSNGSLQPATSWTLDNYGSFLVGCANTDGKLYFWDGVTATASVMSGAPTGNNAIFVTEERFVFALGAAGNRALIQWSDQEDFTTWTPAATNQAGDFILQTNGEIMSAIRVRGQSLILTTTDAHIANYLGAPLVYGFERVGSGCGIVGAQAGVATDSIAVWMGQTGFFAFDGYVKPLPCDVLDYVYSDINRSQLSKVSAWDNDLYNEVWWHYPSGSSNECNRYVAWNYRENTWSFGEINRTCGSSASVYDLPILASTDGYLYSHEVGFQYDGAIPFAETCPFELGSGDAVYMARDLYPDERTQGDVSASFRTRFYPNGPEYTHGPYSLSAPTSVRFTGRQVVMRIDGARNVDWRFGVPRLDVAQGGLR